VLIRVISWQKKFIKQLNNIYMAEIFYKEESYAIIGCCIEVWKTLGYGFSEVVYKDALEIELKSNELPFIRENEMDILYKGKILKHKFKSDFTVMDRMILEIKSGEEGVIEKSIQQTLNYMKASGCRIGLIINFGKSKLVHKRLIF
jgi:GxxExxY protein